MFTIFQNFIYDMMKNSGFKIDSLKILADHVFYIDQWIGDASNLDFFSGITTVIYDIAIWLLVLKFLKNGFETYISWTGGDPDSDPMNMVNRFVKAMVLAICFPVLYDLFAHVCISFLTALLDAGNLQLMEENSWVDGTNKTFTGPLAAMVFWTGFLVLYFQLLKRGAELLVLRLCFPIACVGLIESDNGAYAPFMMMIFKTGMTTIVQLVLFQLAFNLIYTSDVMIGFAFMGLAIAAPKFLQQFMVPSNGGNFGGKALTIARVSEVAIRAVK